MSSVASKSLVPTWQRAGRKDPTLPAILEFQWPSTAIINAPIPRSARGISWMITGMVAALIVASALIPIDQVVTARGIVVSRSATILVQPLETAIVRSIDVHEGQRVRAGDVLARLDPTFASADLAALAATVTSPEAEVARLQAESAGKPFNYTENQPSWLLQAAIHAHRMAEFDSKIENYRHNADELASVTTRAESDATAYRERLNVAQTVEEMRKQLEVLQAGSKLQLLLAKDNRAEMARSLAYAETAEGAKRDKAAVESESNAYIQGWRAEVSQRLAVANEKWSDAREQLVYFVNMGGTTIERAVNESRSKRSLTFIRARRTAIL